MAHNPQREPPDTRRYPRAAFKAREIAELIGVDRWSVYALIRSGRLRATRLAGGTLIVSQRALDDFLDGGEAA